MENIFILGICAIAYIFVCEGICSAIKADSFNSKAIVYAVVSSVVGFVISHM